MSEGLDGQSLEVFLFSPEQDEDLVELLTVLAHYHRTGARLDVGHTVNFGRPWFDASICEYGLLSLPYLDGADFEWCRLPSGTEVRFAWLIPITRGEVELATSQGLEKLEQLFEDQELDHLNPHRTSVVETARSR